MAPDVWHHRMISIHAPREGCDATRARIQAVIDEFQSTHPARGATVALLLGKRIRAISIHAPREGCDSKLY